MTQRPPAPDETLPDETVRMPADGSGGRPPVGGRPAPPATASEPAAPLEALVADGPGAEPEVDDTRPVGREWLEGAPEQTAEPAAAVPTASVEDTVVTSGTPPEAAPDDAAPDAPQSATQVIGRHDGEGPRDPGSPGTPGEPPSGPRRPWFRRPAVAVPVGLLLLLAVVYGVDLLLSRGQVPRNTVVSGVEVGGLTPSAAADTLERDVAPTFDAEHTLVADDVELPFSPAEAGLSLDVDGTVDVAAAQPSTRGPG